MTAGEHPGCAAAAGQHTGAITVLGVGNPIMGDDGIGLALLRRLRDGNGARDDDWVPSVAASGAAPAEPARTGAAPAQPVPAELASIEPAPAQPVPAKPAHEPPTRALSDQSSGHPSIEFVDGGTAGLELTDTVTQARSLLLLDAMAGPGAPGSVVSLEGDQIPRLIQSKLSPHQVGLLDLLAAARLLGSEPERVAAVGIVVESTELGVGLSPTAAASLDAAVAAAHEVIGRWMTADEPTLGVSRPGPRR